MRSRSEQLYDMQYIHSPTVVIHIHIRSHVGNYVFLDTVPRALCRVAIGLSRVHRQIDDNLSKPYKDVTPQRVYVIYYLN